MFNTKRPHAPVLSFEQEGDTLQISAKVKTLLGEKAMPFEQWSNASEPLAAALAEILAEIEDGRLATDGQPRAVVSETHLSLHPELVAELRASAAAALGLPPPASLALDLRSQDLFHEPTFTIKPRWVRAGGGPARASVTGALIAYDGQLRRLPEPLFSLWRIAEKLSMPLPEAERYGLVAELQSRLPEAAARSLQTNGYLEETRVLYASAFSLKLGRNDPFDFDPILFGPSARAISDGEAMLDEEADNVLTPSQQKIFADERFRHFRDVRPAYALKGGQYVYIDPGLRPVLEEVKALQAAPIDQRREFITNPRRILRQRLGDDRAEACGLETLFVETEQFSARVAGVDVWTKPVLPWIKPIPNTWMPEKFGIRIGDDAPFEISPADVIPLSDAVDAAIEDGQPSLDFGGRTIPATAQTQQALSELRLFVDPQTPGCQEDGGAFSFPAALREKRFLTVKENFEDLEYVTFDHAPEAVVDGPFVLPDQVTSRPKPHQNEGMAWLRTLYLTGKTGALLADDMGLGKTYQAIGFMAWLQAYLTVRGGQRKPFLIVAPTGLLANWRKEIDLHLGLPWLGDVVLAFGSNLKALREEDSFNQKDIDAGRASLQASAWSRAGVVLTTYETLRDYHFSFAKTPFELVVFDEIQKLKNPTSQLTKAAKTLNARFSLGMTGTPVENRLQDIWSITDVLRPGFLGLSRDFEKTYASSDRAALRSLRSKLCENADTAPPFMLRRMKADHLPEMPEKSERAKAIQMPPFQAQTYEDLIRRAMAGRGNMGQHDGMLQILHAMRSVSLHPSAPGESGGEVGYVAQSARLIWTMEILEDIRAQKEKALIFVESLDMQACLAKLIQTRFGLRSAPSRIHGGVPGAKRQDLVEAFQARRDCFDVMILSPKAGGVGLTLTAANHVIHLSRWWNPAVEDQSTDRVYRIGQTKPVRVYLPMAVHPDPMIGPSSFDLKLNELLERKRALSRDMLVAPEGDDGDISDLFDSVSNFDAPARPPVVEVPASAPPEPDEAEAAPATATPATPLVVDVAPPTAPAPKEPEAPVPLPEVKPVEVPKTVKDPPVEPVQTRRTLTLPGARPHRPAVLVWDFPTGQPRDLSELMEIFAGAKLSTVKISDPYAIANGEARQSQVDFLERLRSTVARIDSVLVEYDPRKAEPDETDELARRQMGALWSSRLGMSAPALRLDRRQASRQNDFHDRYVYLESLRAGGAVATHELRLSRGLFGLMTRHKACSVTYLAPREDRLN